MSPMDSDDSASSTQTGRRSAGAATRPAALVTSPWAATIRYRGPLLDYGNVIVLEPGGGYLMIIAGLQDVFGEQGEVVAKGAALGLMGGTQSTATDLLAPAKEGGGARETETLYLEIRKGAAPVDPMDWFKEKQSRSSSTPPTAKK